MRKLKRSECAVLHLVMTRRWFDMVALGLKREEYRDHTTYWKSRMDNWKKLAEGDGKPMVVEFRLGYAARAQRAAFLAGGVFLRDAYRFEHPDWGEPCGAHFVLRLGERVVLAEAAPDGTGTQNT